MLNSFFKSMLLKKIKLNSIKIFTLVNLLMIFNHSLFKQPGPVGREWIAMESAAQWQRSAWAVPNAARALLVLRVPGARKI